MRWICRICCVAVAAMLGVFAEGCAPSPEPTTQATARYAEPKLAREESAIVKSSGGVMVVRVDGADVAGTSVQMANFGGNSVVLTPGTHRIIARRAVSGTPITYNDVTFEQKFEAGHTYSVGPDSVSVHSTPSIGVGGEDEMMRGWKRILQSSAGAVELGMPSVRPGGGLWRNGGRAAWA